MINEYNDYSKKCNQLQLINDYNYNYPHQSIISDQVVLINFTDFIVFTISFSEWLLFSVHVIELNFI